MPTPLAHPAAIILELRAQLPPEPVGQDTPPTLNTSLLALMCLRLFGYCVDILTRKAWIHRTAEDDMYRDFLAAAASHTGALQPLVDRARSREEPEEERFKAVTLHALRVRTKNQEWVMDEWGNSTDDEIFAHAADVANRQLSHYHEPWKMPANPEALEAALSNLGWDDRAREMTAKIQATLLQKGTSISDASALHRRL